MTNQISTFLLHTWVIKYDSLTRFYTKYYWNLIYNSCPVSSTTKQETKRKKSQDKIKKQKKNPEQNRKKERKQQNKIEKNPEKKKSKTINIKIKKNKKQTNILLAHNHKCTVFLCCVNLIDFSVIVPTVIGLLLSCTCAVFIIVWHKRKKLKSSMCQFMCMYTHLLLDQSFLFYHHIILIVY